MKSLSTTVVLLILAIVFTGCFSSKEEVWINADGSGKMETVSDMSDMYPFIAMGMAAEKEKIANGEDVDDNPFMDLMMAEEMDTTFVLKDFMTDAMNKENLTWEQMLDSIRYAPTPEGKEPLSAEDREAMVQVFESMMETKMRWQVSQQDQMMKSTQIQDFADVNDLKDKTGGMMEMMKKIGEISGDRGDQEDKEIMGMFDQLSSAVTLLSLSGNKLRIKRTGMDLSSLGEENEQMLSMMQMFLKEDYQIIIHFPGKVKKVSSDVAQIVDNNSIKIEFPMEDLFDPQLNIDVEIVFKGLDK